ncbi:unnamed protein product [Prorocentrum cordatum]|uniref:SGNH hydrolase-type esterase domain-containing protein n=1 Tax=Prorocentrum cordatum TaxID=2364126 RepID=A0ABN9U825_9DINO|nr:unnamed protein product [Polarella glacialis]
MPRVDLIFFNWGLHNTAGTYVPGRQDTAERYMPNLEKIVDRLVELRSQYGTKLLFGTTTPHFCNQHVEEIVKLQVEQSTELMTDNSIPVVDLHAAIVDECGAPPQETCLNLSQGGCPHYSEAGYEWIANRAVGPTILAALAEEVHRPLEHAAAEPATSLERTAAALERAATKPKTVSETPVAEPEPAAWVPAATLDPAAAKPEPAAMEPTATLEPATAALEPANSEPAAAALEAAAAASV